MTPELKKTLLTRKFSSIEYMQELENYMSQSIQGLVDSLNYFNEHCSHVDMNDWVPADTPQAWEDRALPNFNRILTSIKNGIDYANQDDPSYIEGVTGSMQGLSKDMDVLGRQWWKYVDSSVVQVYGSNMNMARQTASNIWHTVGDYFEEDEILDEEITGPIDEQDLLRYLKPGETA
ncbi:MAG: hypothetical protein ACPGGD_04340 [Thalassolituus sp.]|jgi:hypothetical protein